MMPYSNYDARIFEQKVREALQTVERVLERPRGSSSAVGLLGEAEHSYREGYGLVDTATNTAIAAQLASLSRLGLTPEILESVRGEPSVTLRFEASDSCSFLKEEEVEVALEPSIKVHETKTSNSNNFFTNSSKTKTTTVIKKVKEFHWRVDSSWEISLVVGNGRSKTVLLQRSGSGVLVRQSVRKPPLPEHRGCKPLECPLSWHLSQASSSAGGGTTLSFRVDTRDPTTRTPFRNASVEGALVAMSALEAWARGVRAYFVKCLQQDVLDQNDPANPSAGQSGTNLSDLSAKNIFVPVLGLLLQEPKDQGEPSTSTNETNEEEKEAETGAAGQRFLSLSAPDDEEGGSAALLPLADLHKLLDEHASSLDAEMAVLQKGFPGRHLNKLVSAAEASVCVLSCHLTDLSTRYRGLLSSLRQESEGKLVAALGKTVGAPDIDRFCRWHNSRFLSIPPSAFCKSIRSPSKYPDGLLSVEEVANGESIATLSRDVDQPSALRIPLHAATTISLTGSQHLHGWVRHRFGPAHDAYHIAARARQFSSFVLIVGTMAGPGELDPKNAIILRNKDEVLIPLLLEDLPTAKEFKDTIKNLSPEQQNFAMAFRSMQLGSSVLGICVVRIKPQLEALLGLPPDALTKEIGLTEDLMELFVDHQVPSDLLSYDGPEEATAAEKKEVVRAHVAGVKGVITNVKEKQIEEQTRRADMAKELRTEAFGYSGGNAGTTSCAAALDVPYGMEVEEEFCRSRTREWGCFDEKAPRRTRRSMPTPKTSDFSFDEMIALDCSYEEAPRRTMEWGMQSSSLRSRTSMPTPKMASRYGLKPSNSFSSYGRTTHADGASSHSAFSCSMPAPKMSSSPGSAPVMPSRMSALCRREKSMPSIRLHAMTDRDGDSCWSESVVEDEVEEECGEEPGEQVSSDKGAEALDAASAPAGGATFDATAIPKLLDSTVEKFAADTALRPTILKPLDSQWTRRRQENLLTQPKTTFLDQKEIRSEKDKAFDLLDALSRSGSLPISSSELHVLVAVTHCFEKDVMATIVEDNVNPIEKLEMSTLLVGSVIHNTPAQALVRGSGDRVRLRSAFPQLLGPAEESKKQKTAQD